MSAERVAAAARATLGAGSARVWECYEGLGMLWRRKRAYDRSR